MTAPATAAALGAAMVAAALCAASAQAQWRLAAPDLVVGDDDAAFFESVEDVLVRADRVYVADGGLRRIVAFDRATGRLISAAGREGDGPGEFGEHQWLNGIDDCGGDAIFALATTPAQVSVFSLDLEHLRTFRPEDRRLRMFRCVGADALVGFTVNPDPELSRLGRDTPMNVGWRATYDIILYEPNGSLRNAIGPFPGEERYRSPFRDGGGYNDLPLQWGLRPASGYVWVERFPEPYAEDPRHWKVFGPEGSSIAATVEVPNQLDLMWVGETHVAGVVTDEELGVQTVEVRAIERP